jgi:hypothetical protein
MNISVGPLHLACEHVAIHAGARSELGGTPLVDDPTPVDHNNPVKALKRGHPVRDRKHRTSLHQSFKGGLNCAFRRAIEGRRCFIQQQDRGAFQDRSGDRDALALSSGEFHTPVADYRVEALRH